METDFYCKKCDTDFREHSRERENRFGKWLVARCKCGEECIRYLTEMHKDPYFARSKKLRQMRIEHADDLVQPGDSKFRRLYPKQYEKMEKARDSMEAKSKKRKEEVSRIYKENPGQRSLLRKAFEKEDEFDSTN